MHLLIIYVKSLLSIIIWNITFESDALQRVAYSILWGFAWRDNLYLLSSSSKILLPQTRLSDFLTRLDGRKCKSNLWVHSMIQVPSLLVMPVRYQMHSVCNQSVLRTFCKDVIGHGNILVIDYNEDRVDSVRDGNKLDLFNIDWKSSRFHCSTG